MKRNGKMKMRRKKRVKWKRNKPLSYLILLFMIVFYVFGFVTIYLETCCLHSIDIKTKVKRLTIFEHDIVRVPWI